MHRGIVTEHRQLQSRIKIRVNACASRRYTALQPVATVTVMARLQRCQRPSWFFLPVASQPERLGVGVMIKTAVMHHSGYWRVTSTAYYDRDASEFELDGRKPESPGRGLCQ